MNQAEAQGTIGSLPNSPLSSPASKVYQVYHGAVNQTVQIGTSHSTGVFWDSTGGLEEDGRICILPRAMGVSYLLSVPGPPMLHGVAVPLWSQVLIVM